MWGSGAAVTLFGAQARTEKKRVGKERAGGEASGKYPVMYCPFLHGIQKLDIKRTLDVLFFRFLYCCFAPVGADFFLVH